VDAQRDLKNQLKELREANEFLQHERDLLERHLLDTNDLLRGKGDDQDRVSDLLAKIKEQQEEIEALKGFNANMRSNYNIYVPDSADQVDAQLADYINNYPERSRLRVMFMRESEGVYQFGSRRVYVRVERDKIVVRVGGGYLSIDEFLDVYTPMELDRIERNDPLNRFSQKVAVSKTLALNSPLRSPRTGSETRSLLNSGRGTLTINGSVLARSPYKNSHEKTLSDKS